MNLVDRRYSSYANPQAQLALEKLLGSTANPSEYRATMHDLGILLGLQLCETVAEGTTCLLVATAEDADFLGRGIHGELKKRHPVKAAVFWNNHYQVEGVSVAPVVHRFLESGYEKAEVLVLAKAIVSGSCVLRTNLLELVDSVSPQRIIIVSPVMHSASEDALRRDFPENISSKFEFVAFAIDSVRLSSGEVQPGIGGEVYELLGLIDQPARVGFMPKLVRELAAF